MPDLKQPWSERQVAVTCHILKETSRNSHRLVLFGLSVEIVHKSGHTGLCVSFRWLGQRVRIYKACFVQKSIGQLGPIPFYDFYYKLIFERPHHPNNLQLPMGLVSYWMPALYIPSLWFCLCGLSWLKWAAGDK